MTDTRKWSVMAALLAVAVLVAGWFLLVSPKRGEAAELKSQTLSQEEANAALSQQIAVLKAQQADLPEQQAKLAVIKTQIPNNPALPTLIRNLTAAGRQIGVSIDTLTPSVPEPVVVTPAAPVATTTTAATEAGGDSEEGSAAAPVAPVAPAVSAELYRIPLALTVSGNYFELEQFVNKLEGLKRSFLITGFTLAPSTVESADPGDLSLAVTGRVFLAPEVTAAPAPSTPVASAPAVQ